MSRIYNHFHNILRLFDVLPNFPLTTSETMRNFNYKHGKYEMPHKLLNDLRFNDLRKLGNIRKVSKLHRMIA